MLRTQKPSLPRVKSQAKPSKLSPKKSQKTQKTQPFSTFKKVGSHQAPAQPPVQTPKQKGGVPPPGSQAPVAKPAQDVPTPETAPVSPATPSIPGPVPTPSSTEPISTPSPTPITQTPPKKAQKTDSDETQIDAPKKPILTATTTTPPPTKPVEQIPSFLPGDAPKTAILMLNMGGPEDPKETQSFLTNLFSDKMIINMGKFQWLGTRAGASRAPKVQKQYETIGGSPIRHWTEKQGESLTNVLDIVSPQTGPHKHYIGFRYAKPLLKSALEEIKKDGVKRVIAFPQYPMYSCTTTGSSLNDLWEQAKEMGLEGLDFTVIDRWHDNTFFHNAIAQNIVQAIKNIQENDAENNTNTLQKTAILFSAHSIPLKVMNKGDQYPAEISHTVEQTMVKLNQIVKQENTQNNQNNSTAQFGPKSLPILPHQLCWQSKVGFLPWLQPSTSTAIEKLKTLGFTQAIIVPVAFTSDHIETLHEIDIEYQELAHKSGIKLIRAESLNNSMFLTKAQADIVKTHMDNNEIVRSHQYRIKCHECVQPDVCRTVLGYNEDQLFLNKRIPKA